MNKLFTFLLISSFCLLSSCLKDDNLITPEETTPLGTITAKIDGQNFKSTTASAVIISVFGVESFLMVGIEATNTTIIEEVISISFGIPANVSLAEKSYQFDDSDCDGTLEICGVVAFSSGKLIDEDYENSYASVEENASVTMTFTDVDYRSGGNVKGTFSGIIANEEGQTVKVTNGEFDIPIN